MLKLCNNKLLKFQYIIVIKFKIVYLLLYCLLRQTQNYEKRFNKNVFICMSKSIYPNHKQKSAEKFHFIEQWLPVQYTTSVNLLLKNEPKDPAYIRKVKNRKINDDQVIDALYKLSIFNKLQKDYLC